MAGRVAVLAAIALLATALSGCAGSSRDTNTLRVMLANFPADNQGEAVYQNIVKTFHKSYPDIKVEADYVPYNNLNAKIATSLAAGTTYGVISAGIGWVQPPAGLGAIRPLNSEGFSVAQLKKRVYASFVPPMMYQGKLYAVPMVANPRLLAYSKSAFKKAGLDPDHPPQSFTELRADAKRPTVRGSDGRIKQTGFGWERRRSCRSRPPRSSARWKPPRRSSRALPSTSGCPSTNRPRRRPSSRTTPRAGSPSRT